MRAPTPSPTNNSKRPLPGVPADVGKARPVRGLWIRRVNTERTWILRGGRALRPAPFCLAGIVNVTPDSFSDGGQFLEPQQAVEHGLGLLDDGACMLDLGAESTRPFADPVPEAEECARLLPVMARLRERRPDAILSVDTLKAGTARAALEAGADIINDVSACTADPALTDVLVAYKPGYVLMHSRGNPREMQINPQYGDVVEDILSFFERHLARLVRAGLPEDRIVLDPGIGFGKNKDHTVAILKGMERFAALGRPLYVGLSRKSMFRELLGLDRVEQRAGATRLAVALLAARGIPYHRVHDVAGCAQALRLVEAMTPSA